MNHTNKLQPLPVSTDAPIGLEGAPQSGNRLLALLAGLAAAFTGAILCAALMVQTQLQIDVFAVGLGFVVAVAVRKAGGGNTAPFATTGVICALIGCLLAEVFAAANFHAAATQLSALLVVAQMLDDPDLAVRLVQGNFNPLSLVFYAIAIFEGYKLSRRPRW
jgi:hypothetical protein